VKTGIVWSLSGARFLFGNLLSIVVVYAFVATGIILVLVLLRSVVRHTWVADALCVVLLSLVLMPPFPVSIAAIAGWLVWVLALATDVWILRRFGLLALVANVSVFGLLMEAPTAVAFWYGGVFPDDAAPHRVAGRLVAVRDPDLAARCPCRVRRDRSSVPMSLTPGTRLGPYEILARSGQAAWERSTRPATPVSIARSRSRYWPRIWPATRASARDSTAKPSRSRN